MMSKSEVKSMIESVGLPYAYHHFAEGESPPCPFILYLYPKSSNFSADNIPFAKMDDLQIELYSKKRDFAIEAALEAELDARSLFYNKSEVYISSEGMFEVIYELEMV